MPILGKGAVGGRKSTGSGCVCWVASDEITTAMRWHRRQGKAFERYGAWPAALLGAIDTLASTPHYSDYIYMCTLTVVRGALLMMPIFMQVGDFVDDAQRDLLHPTRLCAGVQ